MVFLGLPLGPVMFVGGNESAVDVAGNFGIALEPVVDTIVSVGGKIGLKLISENLFGISDIVELFVDLMNDTFVHFSRSAVMEIAAMEKWT